MLSSIFGSNLSNYKILLPLGIFRQKSIQSSSCLITVWISYFRYIFHIFALGSTFETVYFYSQESIFLFFYI